MAHPMASQSARSQAARLKRIGGKGASAGKAWGSTAMASKTATSYPSKNAGSQVPFFAEGGSVGSRPDRLARGGSAKKKHKGSGHTNVVVQVPPPAAAEKIPTPVPVPKPVPVPVPAGGPPPRPPVSPPGAPAGGPPMLPPGLGAGGPPGIPPGAMPLRKRGGTVGFKSGGSVKLARGGDAPSYEENRAEQKRRTARTGDLLGSGTMGDTDDEVEDASRTRDFFGPKSHDERDKARYDDYKRGGSVKDDDAEEDGETGAEEKKEEKADAKQKGNPGEMLKRGGLVEHEEPDYDRASYIGDPIIGEDRRRPVASRPRNDFEKAATEEDPGSRGHGFPARYAKGGSIKQGGGGSAQANEPGGYPVMKNGGGGGLGRLEKAKKKTA